jgi:alpha-ketoglutarate-dependent taurine dioxygenase
MKLELTKRKAIPLSQEALVRENFVNDRLLPLVLEPAIDGLSLVEWAKVNRDLIDRKLLASGAILFRGFNLLSVEAFEEFLVLLTGELLEYSYRSTPRTPVSGRIYTSTEYPAHQSIPLHNEMSYTRLWPMRLGFFCVTPPEEGGETPIADSRRVFNNIEPAIRERFSREQVSYVRNYGETLDLPWRDVFQTDDRMKVEEFCRQAGIEFEWSGDELRTSQVCQAVAVHPVTGETVWFNQAHLFHVSSLQSEIRESLLASSGDDPPRNAYYGDGSVIPDNDLEQIRAAYDDAAVTFTWQRGDVLIVDNMLVAHGRNPYRGARQIVVGMGQAFGDKEAGASPSFPTSS